MRTNIVIEDKLMKKAMKLSRAKTKKETVEKGLKLLIRFYQQEQIRLLRGKLKWEGNLEKMRFDN